MDPTVLQKLNEKVSVLKQNRDELNSVILKERSDLSVMEAEINKLRSEYEYKISLLKDKERSLQEYNVMIGETENAYSKLIDNSTKLLNAIDQESAKLKDKLEHR
mmetsp:Transcript_36317/g.41386  ORF Transcript_36317/g.41386 Transcript_36317/m.41386 type:complete len:105 (-) Transcript_36317:1301-1615(-)